MPFKKSGPRVALSLRVGRDGPLEMCRSPKCHILPNLVALGQTVLPLVWEPKYQGPWN